MNEEPPTILVVDDEALNLLLINEYLRQCGYRLITARDGVEAWERLQAEPGETDVVVLDLMMPRMDGMEVLRRIKSHSQLQFLPVILQTALSAPEDIHQGIRAGAYYYLTKPFAKEMLRSVVATAVQDHMRYQRVQEEMQRFSRIFGLMTRAKFHYRHLDEGRELAQLLANACPSPCKAVVGLSELLVNAVEHGNLGIGYQEKGRLLELEEWDLEVARRLDLPENRDRWVDVSYERTKSEICIRIRDQGHGFDWQEYAVVNPRRVFDTHGRGIAMARIMSFDRVEYFGAGNEVMGIIQL